MEQDKELSDLLDFSAMFEAGSIEQSPESAQVERSNKEGNDPSHQNQEGQNAAHENELTTEQGLKRRILNLTQQISPQFGPSSCLHRSQPARSSSDPFSRISLPDPCNLKRAHQQGSQLMYPLHMLPQHSKTPTYQPQEGLLTKYARGRIHSGPQIFGFSSEKKLPDQNSHLSSNFPSSSSHPIYEKVLPGSYYDEDDYIEASLPETLHQLKPGQPVAQDQSDQDPVRSLGPKSPGSSAPLLKYLLQPIGSTSRGQVGEKAQQLSDHRETPKYLPRRKCSRRSPSGKPILSFSAKNVESSDSDTDSATEEEQLGKGRNEKIVPVITHGFGPAGSLPLRPFQVRGVTSPVLTVSSVSRISLGLPKQTAHPLEPLQPEDLSYQRKKTPSPMPFSKGTHHQQSWISSCLETHTTDTESMTINPSVPSFAGSEDPTILKEQGGGLLSDMSDPHSLYPTPRNSNESCSDYLSPQPLRGMQKRFRFDGLNRENKGKRGRVGSPHSRISHYIPTYSPPTSPTTLDTDIQHPSVTEESQEFWVLTSDLDALDTAVICHVTNTLPPSSLVQTCSSSSPDWSQGAPKSFSRSHSFPSLCHMTSAENRALRGTRSLPDLLLKTSCEQFTPDISVDEDDETYRFQCSSPGLYQCSVTGLVFHMEQEGDVVYRSATWNRKLLSQHHKQPAGPLFDIKCEQQSMCQLHLPHCEISSTGGTHFLSVAHVSDEDMEFIIPHKITESHVIINVSGFSDFGIVRGENSPAMPVRALVLLFYQPPVDPDLSSLLNVLLLPRNLVLRDVLRTRRKLVGDEHYLETSPHCRLHPQQEYTLSTCPEDDSVLVEPTTAEFDSDNFDNYFPSFQVSLEQTMKHIKLFLKHNDSSLSVWERRVCLQSSGVQRSCGQIARNLPSCQKLFEIRSCFIKGVSGPVLKSLLDKLLEKTVMTDSERESAEAIPDKRDKARFVIDTVKNKGEAASSEMIEALSDIDPFLCEHLGLM